MVKKGLYRDNLHKRKGGDIYRSLGDVCVQLPPRKDSSQCGTHKATSLELPAQHAGRYPTGDSPCHSSLLFQGGAWQAS